MTTSAEQILGLSSPPVAVAFLDSPPAGLASWDGAAAPAGCAFWKQAMQGKAFYTSPADHHNCAVGSHTHAIALPPERAQELMDTVGFMVSNGYLRMEEVPGIPTLKKAPGAVAYAPIDQADFAADVVIVAANPSQAMMLYEAALRAGVGQALTSVLGRPGCAALSLAMQSGTATMSFGCKGNRTFTGIDDSQMYFVVPGASWQKVVDALSATIESNRAMGAHYTRQAELFPIL
jgi:uncharacterized protein (DUF169 family)